MSCLFDSLGYLLQINGNIVRQQICDFLQNGSHIIEGMTTQSVLEIENSNYVGHMRQPSTMGGAIEIQSACNIWKICIIVHNTRDTSNKDMEFVPLNGIYDRTIELVWNGGHYDPLKKLTN